jgi:hypothetical protein
MDFGGSGWADHEPRAARREESDERAVDQLVTLEEQLAELVADRTQDVAWRRHAREDTDRLVAGQARNALRFGADGTRATSRNQENPFVLPGKKPSRPRRPQEPDHRAASAPSSKRPVFGIPELVRPRDGGDCLKLLRDGTRVGDVKLLNAALRELRYAFKVSFAPYRHIRKVSAFGSARLPQDSRRPAHGTRVRRA